MQIHFNPCEQFYSKQFSFAFIEYFFVYTHLNIKAGLF